MKRQSAYVFLPVTVSMLAAFGAVALATDSATTAVPACDPELVYCPSEIQERVDRSFSDIRIDTMLDAVRGKLTEIPADCFPGECDWRDKRGVRHYFFGDQMVVKSVRADEFVGQPIEALGIGGARRQADVLTNVRRFLPGIVFDCSPQHISGNVGPVECGATLNPGWVQIGFDRDGNLLQVRFDGYHFT